MLVWFGPIVALCGVAGALSAAFVTWDLEQRAGRRGSAAFDRALDGLTQDQREVVHLRFVEGLSAAEVGEIQGRSAGAVRGMQFRALETLRDTLAAPAGGGYEQRN